MSFDAIEKLREAGTPVDQLSDAQKAVLAELTPEEVAIITSVQERMAAAGADVDGQILVGAGIF
jgi:hypothetical protein